MIGPTPIQGARPDRVQVRHTFLAGCIVFGTLASAAGCSSTPSAAKPVPSVDQQRAILSAMKSVAEGHAVEQEPTPASSRGRFSDVPDAMYWAISVDGVEMGIVRREETKAGYIFHLKTVEGQPAVLRVERRPEPEVYHATATVSEFPSSPDHRARAERLLVAFRAWMARFGEKARYPQ